MLVFGGIGSLWGAVVGALAISGLDSFLGQAENGVHIGFKLDLPTGTRLVFLAAIMALVLILRPSGLTGGREFGLPRPRKRRSTSDSGSQPRPAESP
jgi:branched-chain amino acid transport system permease protein